MVLSPFVRPGVTNQNFFNLFSFLRSVEDLFGLGHLGYAAQPDLRPFGSDMYNAGPPELRQLAVRPVKLRAARRPPRRHAVRRRKVELTG